MFNETYIKEKIDYLDDLIESRRAITEEDVAEALAIQMALLLSIDLQMRQLAKYPTEEGRETRHERTMHICDEYTLDILKNIVKAADDWMTNCYVKAIDEEGVDGTEARSSDDRRLETNEETK